MTEPTDRAGEPEPPAEPAEPAVVAQAGQALPAAPRPPRRAAGRVLRGGLLAAAVAAVVALDTGAVALPYSTPVALPAPRAAAATDGTSSAADPVLAAGEKERADAINARLAAMTAAYAAGDETGFLAGVDAFERNLVARMRQRMRNLRAIGYDQVTLRWDGEHTWGVVETSPSFDGSAPVRPVVAGVEVRTRIGGFDTRESTTVLGLTFAYRRGEWWIVDDDEAQPYLEVYTASEPWLLGAVYVVKKPHVVVVGERKHKSDVDVLARQVETAVGDVRAVWKQKSWNGKVVVYATTDKRFVDVMFGGRDARSNRTTKEAVFDAKVEMTSSNPLFDLSALPEDGVPRMVVTPFLLKRHDAQATAVLRHELTHVAFAYEGGDNVPTWLVEGIAEYTGFRTGGASVDGVGALARRGLPRWTWTELKRGTWKPTLVADPGAFYSGSSKHVADTYTTGWLTCLYIADTYGEQSLATLYARAEALGPDTDPETVEATVLKQVLKVTRKGLTKGTTTYAKRIRSRFV